MMHAPMKTLLAASLLCMAAAGARAEPLNYEVIGLQADAHTEVPNDLLTATLFVEQTHADATKLAAEINKTLNQGVRLVHDFPGVKIEAGAQSTWPVYDAKNRLTGWRTRAELRVESKDFDAASKAIAKIQGSMQLGTMSFVLSPDTADATENKLVDGAIKAFRARADIVARAMGAKGWRTVNMHINTGRPPAPMPLMRAAPMAMSADAVPPQEMVGGDTEISVSVSGQIQLQP